MFVSKFCKHQNYYVVSARVNIISNISIIRMFQIALHASRLTSHCMLLRALASYWQLQLSFKACKKEISLMTIDYGGHLALFTWTRISTLRVVNYLSKCSLAFDLSLVEIMYTLYMLFTTH